jgi:lipopolysaccharide transport system ATP-binding protein
MANPIITVEHLCKKYMISHEANAGYSTIRDTIIKQAKKLSKLGKNHQKAYKEEFYALKDVSFEINQGDRVGLIGRNGAGKSTLLKTLCRITEPTEGRITLAGTIASLLEVGTGFHAELTGRENIYLNGAILGMGRMEIRKKFDEIVSFAETEQFLDTPVKHYSSGMYMRLAFAIAAHLEPDILIVDEVLAVGDADFQKKCLGKMDSIAREEGRTVLFVSHNMGILSQLCNKAIFLHKGELISYGESHSVTEKYLNYENFRHTYEYSPGGRKSEIYIARIETRDSQDKQTENFQFDESITICVVVHINEAVPSMKLACMLQNRSGEYLTTVVEDISKLVTAKGEGDLSFRITLKPGVIAPNSYAFCMALFITPEMVYDWVDMACPIQVIDSGTKMSAYENINFGSYFFVGHDFIVE